MPATITLFALLLHVALGPIAETAGQDGADIVLATKTFRYAVGAGGVNVAFTATDSRIDYAQTAPPSPMARVRVGDRWHDSASATGNTNRLELSFKDTAATVGLAVSAYPQHLVMEVVSASDDVEELQWLNLDLTLKGDLEEPFAACVLALNLKTNVSGIPGPSRRLAASCTRRFGIVGGAVAIVGSPMAEFRDALKGAVSTSDTLPQSPVGGPWAMDAPINRASYLFATPTEQNVEEIIRTLKSIGFNQVQIHGGRGTYRFGDCLPNPTLYPNGVASIKAVIDRLHEEGIYAGMHPYAFFIDKATPWVTPVPNPGLAA
ncbi:MAG: hypothetical protein U1E05_25595, partial [Patescibacteria group bacterium]|nr:hypothetical protein [Patescibacteria group bacterium]